MKNILRRITLWQKFAVLGLIAAGDGQRSRCSRS
jgi:hypothetical protein